MHVFNDILTELTKECIIEELEDHDSLKTLLDELVNMVGVFDEAMGEFDIFNNILV